MKKENRIPADFGDEPNPEEIISAPEVTPPLPPELDNRTKDVTEWDDPPASHGEAAPKVGFDDENSVASELVEEGIDEADREQRLAAEDPDFEG